MGIYPIPWENFQYRGEEYLLVFFRRCENQRILFFRYIPGSHKIHSFYFQFFYFWVLDIFLDKIFTLKNKSPRYQSDAFLITTKKNTIKKKDVLFSSKASILINIRWIRTSSQPYGNIIYNTVLQTIFNEY